ncbi:hypothetical protein H4582DRAFT_1246294 [Lactarius indigo]|nr:hypothetical protein H4582DRAFT_1246294 [Lactarius indigo]
MPLLSLTSTFLSSALCKLVHAIDPGGAQPSGCFYKRFELDIAFGAWTHSSSSITVIRADGTDVNFPTNTPTPAQAQGSRYPTFSGNVILSHWSWRPISVDGILLPAHFLREFGMLQYNRAEAYHISLRLNWITL